MFVWYAGNLIHAHIVDDHVQTNIVNAHIVKAYIFAIFKTNRRKSNVQSYINSYIFEANRRKSGHLSAYLETNFGEANFVKAFVHTNIDVEANIVEANIKGTNIVQANIVKTNISQSIIETHDIKARLAITYDV